MKAHIRQLIELFGFNVKLNTGNKPNKSCFLHVFFYCWVICMPFIWCEYLEEGMGTKKCRITRGKYIRMNISAPYNEGDNVILYKYGMDTLFL